MNEEHFRLLEARHKSEEDRRRWLLLRLSDVRLDLADADLSGKELKGVELFRADLRRARLLNADLTAVDLTGADLTGANLEAARLEQATLIGATMANVNLTNANLMGADLTNANLSQANLAEVHLVGANLEKARLAAAYCPAANFVGANLQTADLSRADLSFADLSNANLSQANLNRATLVNTNFAGANLAGCSVFGVSAWKLDLAGASQTDLIISDYREPIITVDNLEVAQFIYLLLHNEKIRQVIDTITSKVVLILGRFSPERKAILDALRTELRKRNYSPILFDFEQPVSRDLTETVSILAHLARFIIADISEAKSIPQELQRIIPDLPSVPVQPLIVRSEYEYALFEHFRRYPWVLDVCQYDSLDDLLSFLEANVITPAEEKAKELTKR